MSGSELHGHTGPHPSDLHDAQEDVHMQDASSMDFHTSHEMIDVQDPRVCRDYLCGRE
jgi:hypothetical protein